MKNIQKNKSSILDLMREPKPLVEDSKKQASFAKMSKIDSNLKALENTKIEKTMAEFKVKEKEDLKAKLQPAKDVVETMADVLTGKTSADKLIKPEG
jgi:hypothetical protein